MPDMSSQTNALIAWFQQYGIALLVVGLLALLAFRGLRPWVHRVLVKALHAQAKTHDGSAASLAETDRRVTTLETLFVRILRALVVVGVIAIVMGLWMFKLRPGTHEAVRVPVKLGRSSVNTIEILQGLEAGDTVILSDMSPWDAHDRVRLN